jgi:O-antigen/teichoic acid export membrane protein
MASSRRLAANVFSGIFASIFRICTQIVMLPLMARLLGPEELGLYALAMPLMGFVLLLSEAGLGDSLAREKSNDTKIWSSAFWGLMVFGITLAGAAYGASHMISVIAKAPRLPAIMLPLCTTLFMVAATVIPQAMMLRSGNLVLGSVSEFISTLVGAAVAIALAFNGYGVWAMVWQFVTLYFVRMVILNLVVPFVPRFEFSLRALMSHTGVGGAILGGRLMDACGRMIENAKISDTLGAASLGSYGYANQIGRFFSDAVANTVWSNLYYVAINKSASETVAHYILSHRLFALILFPAATLFSLSLPVIVPLLLGPKWVSSTYPIMILTLSSPFAAMGSFCGAVMFARKQIWVMLSSFAVLGIARVMAVYFGHAFGVTGITIGLAISNIGYYLFVVIFVSPLIGNSLRDLLSIIVGPLVAAAAAGAVFVYMLGSSAALTWLAMCLGVGLLVYVLTLAVIDWRNVKRDVAFIGRIVRGRQKSD